MGFRRICCGDMNRLESSPPSQHQKIRKFPAVKTSRPCLVFSPDALRCGNSDPCLVKSASVSKWTFVTSASTVLIVAHWPSVLPHPWKSSWRRPYTWTAESRLRGAQVSSDFLKMAGLLVWTAGRSAVTETQCGLLHYPAGRHLERIELGLP